MIFARWSREIFCASCCLLMFKLNCNNIMIKALRADGKIIVIRLFFLIGSNCELLWPLRWTRSGTCATHCTRMISVALCSMHQNRILGLITFKQTQHITLVPEGAGENFLLLLVINFPLQMHRAGQLGQYWLCWLLIINILLFGYLIFGPLLATLSLSHPICLAAHPT